MPAESFHFDISGRGLGVLLGSTEAKLMELVWEQKTLTVKSALFHLDRDDRRAYTTVMTVLNRLVDKGLLIRVRDGRNYVYRAGIDVCRYSENRRYQSRGEGWCPGHKKNASRSQRCKKATPLGRAYNPGTRMRRLGCLFRH